MHITAHCTPCLPEWVSSLLVRQRRQTGVSQSSGLFFSLSIVFTNVSAKNSHPNESEETMLLECDFSAEVPHNTSTDANYFLRNRRGGCLLGFCTQLSASELRSAQSLKKFNERNAELRTTGSFAKASLKNPN